MNLVGELVLARNRILQCANKRADQDFLKAAQPLNLITTDLLLSFNHEEAAQFLRKFF
jgi:chemotaxis protein histidine kinase CheA